MGILEWLQGVTERQPTERGDTDTVRRIVAELDRLEPARARHLAAFAYVLSRVAGADLHYSSEEMQRIAQIVQDVGHLPEEQAVLIAEIAKSQNRLFGGTENFLVTREFNQIATDEQRSSLLDCLFAIAAADHAVSGDEEQQIRQIASELGLTHEDFIRARMAHSDKRTVLKQTGKA
ncbi:MAG: TerB family tellurite resistance protein [Vicinamibacterales bacterium]